MRDSTVDIRAGSCVPQASTLDAWSSRDWSRGIDVTRLSPLDELIVTTRNSTYTILVVNPSTGDVKIRGGAFFPSFATARICGSSLGRGFLKRHQDKLLFGSDCSDRNARGGDCLGTKILAAIGRLVPDKAVERKILFGNASKLLKITV